MTEAQARAAIVAYSALLWERRLVFGSSGNVSVRLDDGTIVVTPTTRSLRALEPDALVRVAADGTPLDPERRATSELPLHLAAYRVRADVRCVVHTHPTNCVAWSKHGRLFPLDTVGATESLGPIAFTPFEKPGSQRLAEICAEAFAAQADTIVMERHGLSSAAADLETAFLRTDLAEQTAHIELAALLLGAAKRRPMSDLPEFPHEDLKAAAGDAPGAHAAIDALHGELQAPAPDASRISRHVEHLRGIPALRAQLESWWLDPRVETFIADLNSAGL